MRGSIVLTLFAGLEVVFARAFARRAQSRFSYPACERAVADLQLVLFREQLAHPHPIAAGALEARLDQHERWRIARRILGFASRARAQNAAYRVTRELERPADLAQRAALGFQRVHRRADLLADHIRNSS